MSLDNGAVVDSTVETVDNLVNMMAEGTVNTDDTPTLETAAAKKDPAFVHVPFEHCPDLLAVLRDKAGNEPLGPFVAALLCEKYGVTYDRTDGRKRHNSEEERKAAIKASQVKRADKIKMLSAQHKAKLAGDMVEVARLEAILYPPKS